MKCLLAYRAIETELEEMKKLLAAIREVLNSLNIESYSLLLDYVPKEENNAREFMDQAFKEINNSDFLFVIQNNSEKSEGMLMEVGYCIAKNIPVVVAKKTGVADSYLSEMTEFNIYWHDTNSLLNEIMEFDFSKLS